MLAGDTALGALARPTPSRHRCGRGLGHGGLLDRVGARRREGGPSIFLPRAFSSPQLRAPRDAAGY
jgi:hypothetical protein